MGIALRGEMHRSRSGRLLWDSKAQLSICLSKKLPCHGKNNLGLNTVLNLQARTIWQGFKGFCCIVTTVFFLRAATIFPGFMLQQATADNWEGLPEK